MVGISSEYIRIQVGMLLSYSYNIVLGFHNLGSPIHSLYNSTCNNPYHQKGIPPQPRRCHTSAPRPRGMSPGMEPTPRIQIAQSRNHLHTLRPKVAKSRHCLMHLDPEGYKSTVQHRLRCTSRSWGSVLDTTLPNITQHGGRVPGRTCPRNRYTKFF